MEDIKIKEEMKMPKDLTELIIKLGNKMNVHFNTIGTALINCHLFYLRRYISKTSDTKIYKRLMKHKSNIIISSASLLLACKSTFVLRTVREIVIAAWAIQKPEVKPLNQEDLKCKQLMREVINAESDLVGLLGIDFSVKLPEIVLQYKSNEIALAAVYIIISKLSLRCTENFTDLCKKFGKANPVSVMKLFEKLS
nr:15144_t:CDS:2 [Entrophospora candida]